MHVKWCTRIKWVWISEILSLFCAHSFFLVAKSSTPPLNVIGTNAWWLSASSSCQPPGNWYSVRHNLFHIHSSFKRIPFRVGLPLTALQLADMRIKFLANGSHFESVGFHRIKKCALKQILLMLERFHLCEINVQVHTQTPKHLQHYFWFQHFGCLLTYLTSTLSLPSSFFNPIFHVYSLAASYIKFTTISSLIIHLTTTTTNYSV